MDKTSLQELCLQRIADDIQFWCSGVENESLNNGYLYMLGPFDHLGSRQIQELLTILAKKKLLKASYLQSLLHHGITSLDLSPCSFLVSDAVVQMISRRCQKLHHLAMPCYNKRISVQLLQDLPAKLPRLCSLDLSGSSTCNDNVLMAIGQYCKNIHVLKLRSCQKLTDRGLAYLNNSTSIVELNLSGTNCSPEGVLMLLQNHPHLQSLSLEGCTAKDQPFFNNKFLSLYKTRLRYLDLSNTHVNDISVANITKICPDISTLYLAACGDLTGESLLHLKALEHLKHLEIHALEIDCSIHLPVFLRQRGTCLETLNFILSSNIDIGMIAQYCPNLTNLTLEGSTDMIGSLVQRDDKAMTLLQACPHLKNFNIQSTGFSGVKSLHEHFSSIFNHESAPSQLEVLNLSDIDDFELDGIEPFIESPCLSNLQSLDISFCTRVHGDLVLKIVQCCKKLQYLNVTDCWCVNRIDVERAQKLAKEKGRHLEIDWN